MNGVIQLHTMIKGIQMTISRQPAVVTNMNAHTATIQRAMMI